MPRVLACGVPRSGSTLVWQILIRSLPGRDVKKAHPASWAPEEDWFIVGSVRHPYDMAASCFRARVADDDGDGIAVKGNRAGLLDELRMLQRNFAAMRALQQRWPETTVILRYEDFFDNFDTVHHMIEQRLGVTVPVPLRETIRRECSFRANLRRSCKDIRGPEYQRTKINHAHVGVGIPGAWRTVIPKWGYAALDKVCGPICKEWGYAHQ